jgi:hypothetical protein
MMTKPATLRAALPAAAATLALLALTSCGTNEPSAEATPTPTTASPLDFDGPTPSAPTSTPYISPPSSLPPATALPSEQPGTPGRAGTPRGLTPDAAKPDRSDPTSVAAAFALLLTTYDVRIDNQPADAGRRAAVLATPALAAELRQPPPGGNPGVTWTELADHDGYTRCTAADATEAGAPADSASQATRAIRVSCASVGTNWNGDAQVQVIFVSLSRTNNQWAAGSYSVQ